VLREIHHVMPVGVWRIREGVHQALYNRTNMKKEFDSLEGDSYACSSLSVSKYFHTFTLSYFSILSL